MIRILRGRGVSTSTGSTSFRSSAVVVESGRVVHWSHTQLRGRSRAASDPADMPNVQKSYRRVSKEERRAMVVSYVNKYRESYEGNYPLLSDIQREVGGSFYVIRSIFQELQYKSRMPPSTVVKESNLQANVKKEVGSLIECEILSTEVATVKVQAQTLSGGDSKNELEGSNSKDKLVEAPFKEIVADQMKVHEAGLGTTSSNLEADSKDASHAVVIERRVDTETDGVSHATLEKLDNDKNKQKELPYKVNQSNEVSDPRGSKQDSHLFLEKSEDAGKKVRTDDSHSVMSKNHPQESGMHHISHSNENQGHDQKQNDKDSSHLDGDAKHPIGKGRSLESYEWNHNAGLGDNAEHQNKSSIWDNLKSFAGGIINLWRKL